MPAIKTNPYNMKRKILLLSATGFFLVAVFTGCKKETGSSTDNTTEASIQSDDQARVSTEVEAVANDADVAMESSTNFSGRYDQVQQPIICDATLLYVSVSNPITVTITYNSRNCLTS